MTKEELKNKISMELKDPITQQGFEIICKELADLERENAELKLKLEALEGEIPWKDIKAKSEVIGKLTKAKELLEEVCNSIPASVAEYMSEPLSKAREFFSEVEK